VLMTNRPEFLSAVWGTALAGSVATTLNTFSTRAELDHLLKASGVSVLLMEGQVLKKDFAAMLGEIEPAVKLTGEGQLMATALPFSEMLFTGRPFTAAEMDQTGFINSVVPRDRLEAEVDKYADACSRSRPVDVVVAQKTFLETYKQYRGEYLGSKLTGWLEGMLPMMKPDRETSVDLGGDAFDGGIAKAVKNNDRSYPPEWRLSRKGREAKE
jgi:hypothetical protein